MAYNTKEILKDKDLNPISQYYNPTADKYEAVEGASGGNKVILYNEDGTENNGLSLLPILDKLTQLTGTVIDENTRKTNEIDRKAKEVTRESNESTRKSNETTRKSNETARGTAEGIRVSQENTRKSNEVSRISNMDIVQGWINNPSQFNGKDIEYNWNGTQLGIRVAGQPTYSYVDLKGETGSIDSLTTSHITTALGYTPFNASNFVDTKYTAGTNVAISGSNVISATDTISTKTSIGLANVTNDKQMPISNGVLENYREKLNATTGVINLSLGNVFTDTPNANRTYSITNAITGQAHSFTLIITQGATVRTITFPASVKWQGGEIPNLSGANKTYVLTFVTVNGGTTWLGMFGGMF